MEKFNELFEQLQKLRIVQTSINWVEDLPEQIWNDHFKGNFKTLKNMLDIDQRGWYETSITVIEIYGKLLGIRHVSNLYSENKSCEDYNVTIEFFEMEEIMIKSYKRKSNE
jgi:hypothetical protein